MTASLPKTMRAMVIHHHGGPDVLTLEREWPRPVARAGEIVVAVKACGLNYLDIFTRDGMPGEPTPLPHITGGDIAGIVAETGPGVDQPAVGARVLLNPSWGCGRCEYCRDGETTRCLRGHMLGEMDPGGLAEYVRAPAAQAIPIPSPYAFELAACLPVAWGTACRMVVTHGHVIPGDTVVVTAAAGGVGLGAVQIAKLQGARVIALASSDDKLARLLTFGADETINYVSEPDWDARVRRLTGKRGADAIIETVGATTCERSIRALGKGGRLVTSGASSGPVGPTDIGYLFRREHRILGSNGWTHNALLRVATHAFGGRLHPVVDRVLPLERTAEGEVALASREVFGKGGIAP